MPTARERLLEGTPWWKRLTLLGTPLSSKTYNQIQLDKADVVQEMELEKIRQSEAIRNQAEIDRQAQIDAQQEAQMRRGLEALYGKNNPQVENFLGAFKAQKAVDALENTSRAQGRIPTAAINEFEKQAAETAEAKANRATAVRTTTREGALLPSEADTVGEIRAADRAAAAANEAASRKALSETVSTTPQAGPQARRAQEVEGSRLEDTARKLETAARVAARLKETEEQEEALRRANLNDATALQPQQSRLGTLQVQSGVQDLEMQMLPEVQAYRRRGLIGEAPYILGQGSMRVDPGVGGIRNPEMERYIPPTLPGQPGTYLRQPAVEFIPYSQLSVPGNLIGPPVSAPGAAAPAPQAAPAQTALPPAGMTPEQLREWRARRNPFNQ